MVSMPQGRESLFKAVKRLTSDAELAGFLSDVSKTFGFAGYMIIDLPSESDESLAARVILTSMPMGFIESYDALRLLKTSPIFSKLRRTTVPLKWTIDAFTQTWPPQEAELARALFESHKFTMGIAFPVHGADGSRGVVIFNGDRPALSSAEMSELGMLTVLAYDFYRTRRGPAIEPGVLTARELEVLHWVANGKTSTEVASILSLSDHTVNTYLNAAMRKMDCVNRTQLVAKALRLHLIS